MQLRYAKTAERFEVLSGLETPADRRHIGVPIPLKLRGGEEGVCCGGLSVCHAVPIHSPDVATSMQPLLHYCSHL